MTLQFPTIAEQVVQLFREHKIKSIAAEAARMKAHKRIEYGGRGKETTYTFDDDTSIITSGCGSSYQYRTELP